MKIKTKRLDEPVRAYVAANDNNPRHADDFTDLADRRAWIASLPDKAKPVLAWPTIERLARLDSPNAARALFRYAELMLPTHMVAANDNDDPSIADLDAEMRHEIRPSIAELMLASAGHDAAIDGEQVTIGALVFRKGALAQWGERRRGAPLKPVERQRSPRGTARKARSEADIRFLLPANDNSPIAKGASFLAGIKGKSGTGTRPDIGDHAAGEELVRNQQRAVTRLALGRHAGILDMAITDSTAMEIGGAMGFSGKPAERRAIAAINEAIAEFEKITGDRP